MVKGLKKLRTEESYLNIIKAIYDKPKVNAKLNGEKLRSISSKIRNDIKVSTLSSLIQHST
jgi:hypothetical protein